MEQEIRVGDRIKIIKISDIDEIINVHKLTEEEVKTLIGVIGTVNHIYKHNIEDKYPYEILFDSKEIEDFGLECWAKDELALIPNEDSPFSKAINNIISDIEDERYNTLEEIVEDLHKLKKIGR